MHLDKNNLKLSKPFSIEAFEAQWAEEDAYDRKHPIKASIKGLYRSIRRFIYNLPDAPRQAYRTVKRGIQRGYRGWSDEDVWEMCAFQSRVTYAMLVNLKANKMGYPATIDPKTGELDYDKERWDAILDAMIYGWKLTKDIADGEREGYYVGMTEEYKTKYKMLTEQEEMDRVLGLLLYCEKIQCLWD